MDIIDQAQDYQQRMIDAALSRQSTRRPGRHFCARLDCDEPISETRRALGAQLCIDCAEAQELRQRSGVSR